MGRRHISVGLSVCLFVVPAVACTSSVTGTGGPGSDGGISTTPAASGRVALDANQFCGRLIDDCKSPVTRADCLLTFQALVISKACADGLTSASCADLGADQSPISAECFPPCSTPGVLTCNGDGTITECSQGREEFVADCARTCQLVAKAAWSGVCGKTYQTQTADHDKCWCQ